MARTPRLGMGWSSSSWVEIYHRTLPSKEASKGKPRSHMPIRSSSMHLRIPSSCSGSWLMKLSEVQAMFGRAEHYNNPKRRDQTERQRTHSKTKGRNIGQNKQKAECLCRGAQDLEGLLSHLHRAVSLRRDLKQLGLRILGYGVISG